MGLPAEGASFRSEKLINFHDLNTILLSNFTQAFNNSIEPPNVGKHEILLFALLRIPRNSLWYAHVTISKVEEKLTENGWIKLPRNPLSNLTAGIDLGVNNLMAVYLENGESFLVNGRPLKSIAFYWQKRIAEYQSKINKSGAKKSRKLKRMHEKAKLQAKHYINTVVRQTVEKLFLNF